MDIDARSLPHVLRAAARRHPDRTALTGCGLTLTYGQLDTCVSRLAADFAASGLRPGELVGLAVDRGPLPLVLAAAVMRAGCAYVPLDVGHPRQRLRHVVATAGLHTTLCDESSQAALRGLPTATLLVDVDDVRAAASGPPPRWTEPEVDADGIAYVMFTSGSSGIPKGVAVTHGNLVALLRDALGLFRYGDDEVWPLVHGYGFDVSVWEMWAGVAVGARLLALDGATVASPPRLAEALVRHRPTRLHIVPSVFRHLTDAVVAAEQWINPRAVVFCGEAVNHRPIQTWLARVPGPVPRFVNVYGITETTVYNTFHAFTPEELREPVTPAPIGRAYRHSPIVVLDADLRPLPPGEPGELVVGGRQVSPGYLHNPALTAERFLRIDGLPGRWYRTGDLGFATADGVLHCLGRADDQVKVRGLRIELGEIDAALRQVPWVRDGAAVVVHSPRGEPVIGACVVPTEDVGDAPKLGELRAALAQTVPDYMLPNTVTVLDRLPQNPNGKVDRRALTELVRAARSNRQGAPTADATR
ncbi:amino acid adenylation domain-containing protein [Micromonospora pallida]|uniref:Amino acid adenylation domain-containing protein n=1 Tax=Micromonospora pallida TaxID=145854 RepID=A0A1C6SDA9_9ACTN|nr:amino acid adenylation domain-containing protein [Micromonospora pallida]SCL27441.1 amino acid adenylation domain-containing protein [Micromonospora pallida]